jgi:hypothetical protein
MADLPTILDLIERFEEQDRPPDPQFFLEFETVLSGNGIKIVPSDNRGFLYRGQNKRWPTCVPSVLRGDPGRGPDASAEAERFRAKYVLSRIQVAQLELLLREHPFTKLADKHHLVIHYDSLAQHYGIPTDWLDLTSSPRIAAFFAVARLNADGKTWIPAEEETGVMYRVRHREVPNFWEHFMVVGHGVAGRPGRQHAYGVRIRRGFDFAANPFVETHEFRRDEDAAREVMAMFDGGAKLYPSDCIAGLTEMVRDIRSLTFAAVRHALNRDGCPPQELTRQVEGAAMLMSSMLNLDVVDGACWALDEGHLKRAEEEAAAAEPNLLKGVGFRLVRERKP